MKGFWRTLESAFAVIMLLSFLLTLGGGIQSVTIETELGSVGYEILKELDNRNELRNYTVNRDYETLNSKIEIPGYNHSIMICDYSGSCTGEYYDSDNIILSVYVISGYDEYEPFEVKLYMWW
ncbi:MAG: hypothetical protein V3U72_01555 [Candidatus Aenigmarchaeota archaeon]